MLKTCHLLLPNGLPCRAAALRNRDYCRHHTPEALAQRRSRPASAPPDSAQPEDPPQAIDGTAPNYLRAYWRIHHRVIAESVDDDQCQQIFAMILMALGERAISPRSAGKLLLAVMDRRRFLAQQAQEAAFRAIEEKVRIHQRQVAEGRTPDDQHFLEALKTVAFSAPAPYPPIEPAFGGAELCSPRR